MATARRGLAAVEIAVCLPILLMITFGVVESCNLI
jgi:Flp pilus assembly protein TadG